MNVGRITGFTNVLGAPEDWNEERDGPCGALPVRVEMTEAGPEMVSAWIPTPEELGRLNAGASIHLTVMGSAHPPVSMRVGPPEVNEKEAPDTLVLRVSGVSSEKIFSSEEVRRILAQVVAHTQAGGPVRFE